MIAALALVGSCEAYTLLAAPGAGMRVMSPKMQISDAAKSWYYQQPQKLDNFEPGFGDNTYGRREMLASAGTAAPADTTDAAKAWYYQQPQAKANFEPGFGDNTYSRRKMLNGSA